MINETKSNWACVTDIMKEKPPIACGDASHLYKNPLHLLSLLSYYKFAGKLIGKNKKVLDFGCDEGLGTWVLAKECGYAKGIDRNRESIEIAQKNYVDASIDFNCEETLSSLYDAIVQFSEEPNLAALKNNLTKEGICILGTHHISSETLEIEMKKHFANVFLFCAHEEVIYTGNPSHASYLIAVGCKKK